MPGALVGWPIIGVVVAALVIVGAGALSGRPPRRRMAQISFTASALILGAKTGWWLVFGAAGVSTAFRVIVALVIAGVIGAWWIGAVSWARKP